MKKNKKYTLIKKSLVGALLTVSLAGCVKNVDCDISGNHIHLYQNKSNGVVRYIEGEKEKSGDFLWTDKYKKETTKLQAISKNKLCSIEDNFTYFNKKVSKIPEPKRQAYVYDYIYGTYYGYGYCYNSSTGKYGYGYGLITGYHYDYEWQDIPLDKYTTDEVRDITYKIKLYKVDEKGNVESKLFDQIDDINKEYCYFKTDDIITECISDSYYLDKNKIKTK